MWQGQDPAAAESVVLRNGFLRNRTDTSMMWAGGPRLGRGSLDAGHIGVPNPSSISRIADGDGNL